MGTNAREVLDKLLGSIDRGQVLSRVKVERHARAIGKKARRNQRRQPPARAPADHLCRSMGKGRRQGLPLQDSTLPAAALPHHCAARHVVPPMADECVTCRHEEAFHGAVSRHVRAAAGPQTSTDYAGSRVIRCSEAYTSKQCGACGELNDRLGSSKVFSCAACGATADRDVHAARNILLRCIA